MYTSVAAEGGGGDAASSGGDEQDVIASLRSVTLPPYPAAGRHTARRAWLTRV